MFDYNQYKKELDIINNEELEIGFTEEKYDELHKPFITKRNELNKKYKIILSHNLNDAWRKPLENFFLVDSEQNNVIIYKYENNKQYTYTISYEDIKAIKNILNSTPKLFKKNEIIFPSILDGSEHYIYIRSEKQNIEFSCFNLWYWIDVEPSIDKINEDYYSIEDVEYTKEVIKLFNEIQQILNKNNIKYKILK